MTEDSGATPPRGVKNIRAMFEQPKASVEKVKAAALEKASRRPLPKLLDRDVNLSQAIQQSSGSKTPLNVPLVSPQVVQSAVQSIVLPALKQQKEEQQKPKEPEKAVQSPVQDKVPVWKQKQAEQAKREAEEAAARKKDLEQRVSEATALMTAGGIFGAGPSKHLYRNTSTNVFPQVIRDNGQFQHKQPCSAAADVIAFVFGHQRVGDTVDHAWDILDGYTRAPARIPYWVISATTISGTSLGQDATWCYAFPIPALSEVDSTVIAGYLATLPAKGGGTVLDKVKAAHPGKTDDECVKACLAKTYTWVIKSDGGLPGGMTAFVSSTGTLEHVIMKEVPFTPGQDYFKYILGASDRPYRERWKLLSKYPEYMNILKAKKLPNQNYEV